MSGPTRIDASRRRAAYDVVIGTGLLDELPAWSGEGVAAGARRPPARAGGHGEAVRDDLRAKGFEAHRRRGAGRRGGEDRAGRGLPAGASLGQAGLHPHRRRRRRRRGSDHRPRRVRRRHLAARRPRRPRADHPARHGRRGGRRQDRHQHRRGQEPRRRVPPAGRACSATSTTLETLPATTSSAGLAEVVKCGFIADPAILDLVEADPAGRRRPRPAPVLASWSSAAVRVKADVVAQDLRESGAARDPQLRAHVRPRRSSRSSDYRWRHGAAVSHRHGLRRRARAGWPGKIDDALVDRHRSVLEPASACRRPTAATGGRGCSTAMRRDKKSRGSTLRFVVLDGLARPVRLEGPDPALLQAAYAEISVDVRGGAIALG